jgi:hypothetical protein
MLFLKSYSKQTVWSDSIFSRHYPVKKGLAGMSLNSPWPGIIQLFLAREILVRASD